MSLRMMAAVSVVSMLSAAALGQAADNEQLVEKILSAQAANERLLQQTAGSAVVKKNSTVREDPAKVKRLEKENPKRLQVFRDSRVNATAVPKASAARQNRRQQRARTGSPALHSASTDKYLDPHAGKENPPDRC